MTVGDITSSGNGNTKKQAKQAAAKSMLDILDGRAPSGGDGAKPTTAEGGKKPAGPQVGNKIGMLQMSLSKRGWKTWQRSWTQVARIAAAFKPTQESLISLT